MSYLNVTTHPYELSQTRKRTCVHFSLLLFSLSVGKQLFGLLVTQSEQQVGSYSEIITVFFFSHADSIVAASCVIHSLLWLRKKKHMRKFAVNCHFGFENDSSKTPLESNRFLPIAIMFRRWSVICKVYIIQTVVSVIERYADSRVTWVVPHLHFDQVGGVGQ